MCVIYCFFFFFLIQEGLNILHCAALNNHTEIVGYIVNDLIMKELDKDDQVFYKNHMFSFYLSCFYQHVFNLKHFSQDIDHLHWQQSTAVLKC